MTLTHFHMPMHIYITYLKYVSEFPVCNTDSPGANSIHYKWTDRQDDIISSPITHPLPKKEETLIVCLLQQDTFLTFSMLDNN